MVKPSYIQQPTVATREYTVRIATGFTHPQTAITMLK